MKKLLIFFLGLQASSLYATDTTLHWITRPILDYSDVILCKNRRVWLQHANRSWSLASDNGQIIKTNFEKVTDFDATEQGHAVVKQGGQWCIIDKNGMIIRSLRFENQKIQDVLGISGGLIGIRWASQKASWTFADTTGQLWQNASYEDIRPFSGGIGAVKKNGRWRLINRQQKVLTASKYEDISTFAEGLISVSLEGMQKGLWGYVNANGEIQISFQYFFAGTFAQNRATAQFWDGYQYQCGSINHSGEWVISPQYRDLEPFSEDLAAVRDSTGKWGFIDTAGNQVIKPCFDAVTAFQHNKAWVLNGDKWGILEHPLRGAPVMIRWHHSASTVLHVKEAQYKLQVYLESQQPIHRVTIYLNDKVYPYSKLRGGQVKARGKLFEADLLLESGDNVVVVKAQSAAGESESTERRVILHQGKDSTNKNYVLLVANQNYKHFSPLNKPFEDADSLAHLLMTYYDFEYENIIRCYDATQADFKTTFDSMQQTLPKGSRLLMFYAGHGAYDSTSQSAYWIPIDGKLEDKTTWISAAAVDEFVQHLTQVQHFLLISDACHSGAFVSRGGDQLVECEVLNELRSRRIVSSAENVPVPDQSIFLENLISILREQPYSCVSAFEVIALIRKRVMKAAQMIPQYGTIPKTGDAGGDFVFKRRFSNL